MDISRASGGKSVHAGNTLVVRGITAQRSLEVCKKRFVANYSVKAWGGNQVGVTIKRGKRPIDSIRAAQMLAPILYQCHAVYPPRFDKLFRDERLWVPVMGDTVVAIRRVIPESPDMTLSQLREAGQLAISDDLIIGHSAFLIATGRDFFGGYAIGCRYPDSWLRYDPSIGLRLLGDRREPEAAFPRPRAGCSYLACSNSGVGGWCSLSDAEFPPPEDLGFLGF